MKRIIKSQIFFPLLLIYGSAAAQALAEKEKMTLSEEQVSEIVRRYHPISKQADISVEKSKTDITIAKGNFDPVLQNQTAKKTFDGTNYYYYNRPEFSIPTWFGAEIRGGIEYLSGNRINPEETRGETSYFGISMPVVKNFLMDKRRADLQKAKIIKEATQTEKRSILNTLQRDALHTYWNWVQQYQIYSIISHAVTVNEKRMELIRITYKLGDRPAIDTTEALAQLQSFELLKSQAWVEFQNAGLELSVYLWTSNTEPYYLPETVTPADSTSTTGEKNPGLPELDSLLSAIKQHPELMQYSYKQKMLDIEKKLKFQELLPTVNLEYNQLGKGYNMFKTAAAPLLENNFQYGIKLGIPLRLSQGRGEYKKVRFKITETNLQQSLKQLQMENKAKGYFNELVALKKQVTIQEKAYSNYLLLQRAEELRFQSGESSLFLINARENKALESLQKLVELKTKYYKTLNSLKWAAGILK